MSKVITPTIGLSVYSANDKFHYFPEDYIKAVRSAGGIPLLLPPNEKNLQHAVQVLDGIILTGGGDINPSRYNGKQHPNIYWVNDEQDQSEYGLAETALKLEKPILATCRGMQIINVIFGGTLHAHLPEVYGETVPHRHADDKASDHQVYLEQDSRLAKLMGVTEFSIKSWHHQSIDKLAHDFRVVGFAQDGVIEAIESDSYPNLFAVQWHPEIGAQHDVLQQKLFSQWMRLCNY